jgi:manganese transport protein
LPQQTIGVLVGAALFGDAGTTRLLIFSQVILSMQLPFAVIPLVRFASNRRTMGAHAISRSVAALARIVAAVIVVLNAKPLWDVIGR